MSNVVTAIDQRGATLLFGQLAAAASPMTTSGSRQFGPFAINYAATGTLQTGFIDLIPGSTVQINQLRLDWHLNAALVIDLNQILPPFCPPPITFNTPWGSVTWTPPCIPWPVITIPFHVGDYFKATVNLALLVRFTGSDWQVYAKLLTLPSLAFGPATAAILAAVTIAASAVLLPIPFIGPFLAVATTAILGGITLAGVSGLLGPIITQFLGGREFLIYQRPRGFILVPYQGPNDPDVKMIINSVEANIVNDVEDELRIYVDIAKP